jgi:hypothetical protein
MVAPLKTRGLTEVRTLLGRVGRLYGLRRIGEEDFRFLDKRLKEIEARIIQMHEQGVEELF